MWMKISCIAVVVGKPVKMARVVTRALVLRFVLTTRLFAMVDVLRVIRVFIIVVVVARPVV